MGEIKVGDRVRCLCGSHCEEELVVVEVSRRIPYAIKAAPEGGLPHWFLVDAVQRITEVPAK